MKKLSLLISLLVITIYSYSQLHGEQWVIGGSDPTTIDFRNNNIALDSIYRDVYFFLTSACISDEKGDLLYFSNGINLYDKHGDILENGDSLNPCPYTEQNQDGLAIQQAALFLPQPGNSRYYYLFHFSNDTLGNARPGTLYYSVIDKEGNRGLGEVIKKNVVFAKGKFRGGGMTACKHANGRDWWIVMGASVKNDFYRFLLTPDSLLGPYIQTIGPNYPLPFDNAYSKFSQNGSKFSTGTYEGYVLVMDFDRCIGEFSNPITIFNNASNDTLNPLTGSTGVEFSPSGQYIYVSDRVDLHQYDLWSSNIQDSVDIYIVDTSYPAQVHYLQLAPNGKLYVSCWGGGYKFIHVINRPDEKSDSCNFVYGGQPTLSWNSYSFSNMVNYKLGPLAGSGCDTITDIRQQTQDARQIRIQPNPADKYVYVEMPMQRDYELQLINSTGQLIETKRTPQIDIFDTEKLPAGIYFIQANDKRTGKQVAAQKISVVH